MKHVSKAFTLIELLVVFVIIGILLSYGAVNYSNKVEDARIDTAAKYCEIYYKAMNSMCINTSFNDIDTEDEFISNINKQLYNDFKIKSDGTCVNSPWGYPYKLEYVLNNSDASNITISISIYTDEGIANSMEYTIYKNGYYVKIN